MSRLGRCTTCGQVVKPQRQRKSIRVPRGLTWRFDGVTRDVVPDSAVRDGEWRVHFLAGPFPATPGKPEWSVYVGLDAALRPKSMKAYCVLSRKDGNAIDKMDYREHVLDKATRARLEYLASDIVARASRACPGGPKA